MSRTILIVISVSVATATLAAVVYHYKRRRRNITWKAIGTVESLYIYPLKSGYRVETSSANCTEYGLQLNTSYALRLRDRCLVVYKEETKAFQTARNYKRLLLIEVFATETDFVLIGPESKPLRVKLPTEKDNFTDDVIMWNGEKVFTIDCGNEAAAWISQYLVRQDFGLRLGYHDGLHKRNIRQHHQNYIKIHPKLKYATSGMYSDLSTVLLINKNSVNDLIERIPDCDVTVHNFRPNIVVQGDISPYSEDNWEYIKIGNAIFKTTMPCSRCSMVTLNPETATYIENNEPIRTLKRYRKLTKYKSGQTYPNFGLYLSLEKIGEINAGDIVFVNT